MLEKRSSGFMFLGTSWAITLLLTVLVFFRFSPLMLADKWFLRFMIRTVSPHKTAFFNIVAFIGSPLVSIALMLLIAIIVYLRRQTMMSAFIITILISGNVLLEIVKFAVHRARPATKLIADTGFSFPSGHVFDTTLLVMIVGGLIWFYISNPHIKIPLEIFLVLWVVVVTLSRLYLQVHYPSDVLGGCLYGISWWESVRRFFVSRLAKRPELNFGRKL